jgi:hypothetical protein
MIDQSNTPKLVGALERLCRSGELSLSVSEPTTAAVAVEAGKRLQAHPDALALVDSLPWRRAQRRLRDLASQVPGPLTSDLRELVPRALTIVLRGNIFDPVVLYGVDEGSPECNVMMRRRSLYAVPGDRL